MVEPPRQEWSRIGKTSTSARWCSERFASIRLMLPTHVAKTSCFRVNFRDRLLYQAPTKPTDIFDKNPRQRSSRYAAGGSRTDSRGRRVLWTHNPLSFFCRNCICFPQRVGGERPISMDRNRSERVLLVWDKRATRLYQAIIRREWKR